MSYLVLSRRPGQRIQIGPNIFVTLVSVSKGQAKIAVDAPSNVSVDREEIAKRKSDGQDKRDENFGNR